MKTAHLSVLLLGLTLASATAAWAQAGETENDARAKAALAAGKKFRQAKDYVRAIQAYKTAAALQPSNPAAYFGLALSYEFHDEWQLSINASKRLLALADPTPEILSLLGHSYYALNEYESALKTFQSSLSLDPDAQALFDAQYWIGRSHSAMEHYDAAVSSFNEALRLEPGDADTSGELGFAYYQLKKYPDAVTAFQDALRSKIEDAAWAQYYLGRSYVALGRRDEALQVYGTLRALDHAQAQRLYDAIKAMAATAAIPGAESTRATESPEADATQVLRAIQFAPGSSQLPDDPRAQGAFREIGTFLAQHPDTKLQISGHASNDRTSKSSLALSRRRALAIKEYLIGIGVDGARLVAVAFGSLKPIADNATAAGRARNERVEFQIAAANGRPSGTEGGLLVP